MVANQRSRGAKPRVLLVDDSALLCDGVKRALHCAGIEVSTITDPVKALQLIGEQQYDLVITDIMMPYMSGQELIKRLQATAPSVRCMVITGNTPADQLRQLAAEPNVVGILAKPWNRELLIERVTSALGLQPAVDKASAAG